MAINPFLVVVKWRVLDFGGWFFPLFWQEKDEFLATAVWKLFDENNSNQLCIGLCVQIFNNFFSFKLLLKCVLINTFKIYLPRALIYIHKKLPIMAFENSQTDNDSRSKQLNFRYTTVVLLWNYCKYQKYLVT